MGYTKPYIPRADGLFRNWAGAFCRTLNKAPAAYMMTPAETQDLMERFEAFQAALGRATNPGTRTRGAIVEKDDQRSILQTLIRQYAAFIRCNDGIADDDKIKAGVRPRNIARNKRGRPGTSPLLNYVGSTPGLDQLTYVDSDTKDSKAKPYGAERLELWVAYAEPGEPQPRVSAAKPVGSFKKSKMLVNQDPLLDSRLGGTGKPTYWARWVGYDGQPGKWSLAVSPSRQSVMVAAEAAKKAETERKAAAAQADGSSDAETIGLEGEAEHQPLKKAA